MIVCVPAASDAVANVAEPPDSAPVPSVEPPFMNVTLPVGVPAVDDTVTVKVTGWPDALGLGEAFRRAVVTPLLTVCVMPDDVEAVKLELPS